MAVVQGRIVNLNAGLVVPLKKKEVAGRVVPLCNGFGTLITLFFNDWTPVDNIRSSFFLLNSFTLFTLLLGSAKEKRPKGGGGGGETHCLLYKKREMP